MCFNRDRLLRNAAWNCLAQEHHGRRDGRESALLCFDRDNGSVTIGCDLNRRDAPFEIPTEIWKLTQEERHND